MSALQTAPREARRLVWSLAAVALMALTAPSPAQFGLTGGIGDAFRPGFTARDVQLAVDMLELDEAQRFILETLYEDYQIEFRTGVDGFRDRISNMRTELDPSNPDPGQIMRVVFGSMDEWRVESRQLVEQFIEDLKGLLNEPQMEMWPSFERRLFRLKYLKNGQLSAENLDLTDQVRDLKLEQPLMEQLQPLMEEYEAALDHALRQREDFMNSSQGDLIQAIQDNDPQVGVVVAQRQVELRKAVRDVNEHYTAIIAAALPADIGETFLEGIRQQTYPRVYRITPAQRLFKAAKELEDISEETREAVVELEQAYLTELSSVNEHLVALIRIQQPEDIKQKVEDAATRLSGGRAQRRGDTLREEYAKRREMGERYIEQLKALLTPEQFASLPGSRRWLQPPPGEGLEVKPFTRDDVPRELSGSGPGSQIRRTPAGPSTSTKPRSGFSAPSGPKNPKSGEPKPPDVDG